MLVISNPLKAFKHIVYLPPSQGAKSTCFYPPLHPQSIDSLQAPYNSLPFPAKEMPRTNDFISAIAYCTLLQLQEISKFQ